MGARNQVVKIMNEKSMIDVLCELHGSADRHTWRVICPVVKQARLDYCLAPAFLFASILECIIVPRYRTNHSMLTMKLNINEYVHSIFV